MYCVQVEHRQTASYPEGQSSAAHDRYRQRRKENETENETKAAEQSRRVGSGRVCVCVQYTRYDMTHAYV